MSVPSIPALLEIILLLLLGLTSAHGKPIEIRQSNSNQFLALGAIQYYLSSYLFYANREGNLAYYKSTKQRERAGGPDYETYTLLIDGNSVAVRMNDGVPEATALRYESQGNHLRVYYIDPNGYLKEAGREGNGTWFDGSLNDYDYQVAPGSGVTASVSHPDTQIKVYYYDISTPDQISVAYISDSQGFWLTRTITPGSST